MELELSVEQKALIEADIKEAAKHIVKALVKVSNALALNSENKIDDIVLPVVAPLAEEALINLIGKLKL
jgi:hypothetical protein